ncbi:hypothetical protein VTI74DRAFT_8164 [Chaetomium olivicolor]
MGALLPYFMRQYDINPTIVSILFAANFFGWLFAAITNTHLCQYLDLGAMLAVGAACQVVGHALRAWGPPFGLLAFSFWFITVGQAFQDTHANTFVAKIPGAHRWLGFIHAMYMAGCLVGPYCFGCPYFATGVSVASKLFPPAIHSTALAFVFVIGQIGGSAFPIVTGILASNIGVTVLQPIIVALFVATALTWLCIPAPKSTANRALHQE